MGVLRKYSRSVVEAYRKRQVPKSCGCYASVAIWNTLRENRDRHERSGIAFNGMGGLGPPLKRDA